MEPTLEDIIQIEIDPIDKEIVEIENKIDMVKDIEEDILENSGVTQELAISLESILPTAITKRMPINSFTVDYSMTNLAVATEGVKETMEYLKKNVLDKIIDFIKKIFNTILKNFFGADTGESNSEKAAKSTEAADKARTDSQKKEHKRDEFVKEAEKNPTYVDALMAAVKEDIDNGILEGFHDPSSSASTVIRQLTEYHTRKQFTGRLSKLVMDVFVHDDNSIYLLTKYLIVAATKHAHSVLMEFAALRDAIDDGKPFTLRQNIGEQKAYIKALEDSKRVPFKIAEGDILTTLGNFRDNLEKYASIDPKYNIKDLDSVLFGKVKAAANGSNKAQAKEFIKSISDLNNQLTKLQVSVKDLTGDVAEGYRDDLFTLKTECMIILKVLGVADHIEEKIAYFGTLYVKAIKDVNNAVDKSLARALQGEDASPELKQKLVDYIKNSKLE